MNEMNETVEQEEVNDIPFEEINEVDASQQNETYQVNWEDEAKKFQSMHDKQASENDKMRQDLKYMAEKFAEAQNNSVNPNNQSQQQSLTEDDFNPWDAYYKPESPSYKFRVNEEQKSVGQAVQSELSKVNEQMVLNNTVNELKGSHRLSDDEVKSFMDWSTNPTSNLSLDTLINVWRGETGIRNQSNDSLDAVKAAQEAPRSAGVIQGQSVKTKTDADTMWESIKTSGSRSNVL
tara:strand:+ start:6086 stop:6790 length:705 start_codon:yes stop_codon:yes gene_type:complete